MKKIKNILVLLASVSGMVSVHAQSPNWQVKSADYQFSMNITGVLVNNCVFSNKPTNKVAAFAGDELRGVATFSTENGDLALAFLTVFSNSATGETITFKAYDSEKDEVIELTVQVLFAENAVKGDLQTPFQFYVDAPVLKGNLEIVDNTTIQYSEEIPGAVYTWYKDGTLLGTSEGNSLSVCRSGLYSVVVANGLCSTLKDSVQFTGSDPKLKVKKRYSGTSLSYSISVNECDETFANYTFELMDGDGSEDNYLFEIRGDTLRLKPGLGPQSKINYQIRVKATDSHGNSFEQAIDLEYIALGVKDALAEKVKIYPNPVNSRYLKIVLPHSITMISRFKLISPEGFLVIDGENASNILELPINLLPGMYILELDINGYILQKKLVKE